MGDIQGHDPETLRELVDLDRCRERLADLGAERSLAALLERVWLLKVLDRLDDALALSDESVRLARIGGTRKDLLRARILHATVLQRRGSLDAADQELTATADEAEGQGWTPIAAVSYQHRGKVRYDAGDYDLARTDFKRALFLRRETGAGDEQLQASLMLIEAADRRRVSAAVAS